MSRCQELQQIIESKSNKLRAKVAFARLEWDYYFTLKMPRDNSPLSDCISQKVSPFIKYGEVWYPYCPSWKFNP